MLKPGNTWWNEAISRTTIATITVAKKYIFATGGTEWDASQAQDGSIKCRVEGSKLIIMPGTGVTGKVQMNPDSSYVFAHTKMAQGFTNVTTVTGLENLDSAGVTTLFAAFRGMFKLTGADLNSWDVSQVADCTDMFQGCMALASLHIDQWQFGVPVTLAQLIVMRDAEDNANKALKELVLPNLELVTSLTQAFTSCVALERVTIPNVPLINNKSLLATFSHCNALREITNSGCLVTAATTTLQSAFTANYALEFLDTAKWDMSNVTDLGFAFWGCSGLGPNGLDVRNWDVRKVTSFDHMTAHSYMKHFDVSQWHTDSATSFYAALYSVQEPVIDISGFNFDNVTTVGQMFEQCYEVTKIIGLEKVTAPKCVSFEEMFLQCRKLKEINLPNIDTRRARDGIQVSDNGGHSLGLRRMFCECASLERLQLGPNFRYSGTADGNISADSYALMPGYYDDIHNPSPETYHYYHENWYRADGTAVASADALKTSPVQLSSTDASATDMAVLKNATLADIGNAIRERRSDEVRRKPSQMAEAIRSIPEGGGPLQPLTFTGAVSKRYDGTAPVSVEIPEGDGAYELIERINIATAAAFKRSITAKSVLVKIKLGDKAEAATNLVMVDSAGNVACNAYINKAYMTYVATSAENVRGYWSAHHYYSKNPTDMADHYNYNTELTATAAGQHIIQVRTNGALPAGSVVEIWGVRA